MNRLYQNHYKNTILKKTSQLKSKKQDSAYTESLILVSIIQSVYHFTINHSSICNKTKTGI